MGLYDYRFYLADESECRKLLHEIRWPNGIRCPRCGYPFIWTLGRKDSYKSKCRSCKYKFTETSGTIFEKTRTPLSKWICAIGLFKVGISANQLKDEIRVTYKAAWQMLAKIRKAIKGDSLTDQLSGHIEVDETYFGGKRKGKRGRGAAGKTPVIGIIQRNGAVRTIAIPNVKSNTLQALVKEHVEAGSTIYTDGWQGYRGLDKSGFSHKLVNHDKTFVSRKGHHTNSIEGYWRLSKHKLYARYHKISEKYLPHYLAESEFKFNERSQPDFIKRVLTKLVFQSL
jgi:transposase-like protein